MHMIEIGLYVPTVGNLVMQSSVGIKEEERKDNILPDLKKKKGKERKNLIILLTKQKTIPSNHIM